MTKKFARPQIFVSFENFAIFNIDSIWQQVKKDSMLIIYQNDFQSDDVTAWRQSVFYIHV